MAAMIVLATSPTTTAAMTAVGTAAIVLLRCGVIASMVVSTDSSSRLVTTTNCFMSYSLVFFGGGVIGLLARFSLHPEGYGARDCSRRYVLGPTTATAR
jgi:hypothetical protein